jgi:hypothetical protein
MFKLFTKYYILDYISLNTTTTARKKSKTVIRSVRITKELDNLLEKDAKAKRVSLNSLISMIMTKYVEMDRYNERFGTITLRREGFRSILEAIEDDKITTLAKEIGSQIPKQFLLFWFKKTNLETYLKYLSLVCKYSGFAEYEVDTNEDETDYVITLLHDLGEKWSIFLKNWLEQGMKSTIGIVPTVFDVSKNTVVVRFHTV